jgi:uncharacterized membrane protein (UPF0127 family)
MAKKQLKHTANKPAPIKKKSKLNIIVLAVLALSVLAIFLYNNFMTKNDKSMDYYSFTKEGELILADSLGNEKIKIDIEIADNDYERQLGLMNRKEMKENQGMLFIFPNETMQSFWMRNTLIPLDIVFVNSKKNIVTIHKNTHTLSDQSYPSSAPAEYVLELNAGFTDRHNIQLGDKLNWMRKR